MLRKYIIMLNLLIRPDGNKKARYLKKIRAFHKMGENCYFHPRIIPTEPYLVSMGDNVVVTANVNFVTHDILAHVFSYMDKEGKYKTHFGKIEIADNVFIGQNSVILYNTVIESNVVVSAGSVVHGHIASGSIIAGNPAKVIGSIEHLMEKRQHSPVPSASEGQQKITEYFWSKEYDK